jgi:ABC-type nitrate/sulfonate/bicarbonate transport system substrate-binding protein
MNLKFLSIFAIFCLFALSSCSKKSADSTLNIGYLLNINHAPALMLASDNHRAQTTDNKSHISDSKAQTIDSNVQTVVRKNQLQANTNFFHFQAGGYLVSALFAGNIDLAYLGPGPYLNANKQGLELEILRVVAYGGHSLIFSKKFAQTLISAEPSLKTSKSIDSNLKSANNKAHNHRSKNQNLKLELADCKISTLSSFPKKIYKSLHQKPHKLRLAVPQLGNTQDLLAKLYLNEYVKQYIAVNPAELEFAFITDSVDVALVTEPWGSILEKKGYYNASTLYKKELFKINQYPTTLLVSKNFNTYNYKASLARQHLLRFDKLIAKFKSLKATTPELDKQPTMATTNHKLTSANTNITTLINPDKLASYNSGSQARTNLDTMNYNLKLATITTNKLKPESSIFNDTDKLKIDNQETLVLKLTKAFNNIYKKDISTEFIQHSLARINFKTQSSSELKTQLESLKQVLDRYY